MAISKVLEVVNRSDPLIPGLLDEVAELCLMRLPFPELAAARSVCSAWNSVIRSPRFEEMKRDLALSLPYVFVFAFHVSTGKIQWQAFDPRSRQWYALPPMPCDKPVCSPAFACAAIPRQGSLFVLGGLRSDTETPMSTLLTYRAATNSWSICPPMPTARSFFAAGSIGGKLIAAGGSGERASDMLLSVERYDSERREWQSAASMPRGLARYDAAVLGNRLYVTEGWSWPFKFPPRGGVYDADRDAWEEMRAGLKEGWTGSSAVVDDRLFVVPEHGDCKVKVYSQDDDMWHFVSGSGVPRQLKKPYAVCGVDGRIYVVAAGLHVGIGTVERRSGDGGWTIGWEIVEAPTSFKNYAPSNAQVLYT